MGRFFARFDPGTDVVLEATFNWPWIADVAEEMGLRPHLAHPLKLRQYAKGLAKTDRKDALFQGKIWLAGEIFPESYLAPPPVRRMRALFRLRLLWVRMRTMLKNNVHGQLFKLGLVLDDESSDLFSARGREVLNHLKLKPADRRDLDRKLAVIDELSKHIAELEKEIPKELRKDARAQFLMSLPGVGEKTAYGILAEVGDFQRFPNGRALASYAGLLPVPQESAEREYERRTSPACNKFLRWGFLETVTGAVRSSRRMRSLHARVRARNPKRVGKARVAVAREVAELAHLLVMRGVKYQERPPERPGRRPLRPQVVRVRQPVVNQ
jgi:transposase